MAKIPSNLTQLHRHVAPDQILRLPDALKKSGLTQSTLYALVAQNEFPQSIPLGGRLVGWSSNEIDAWIEQRKACRQAAAA